MIKFDILANKIIVILALPTSNIQKSISDQFLIEIWEIEWRSYDRYDQLQLL